MKHVRMIELLDDTNFSHFYESLYTFCKSDIYKVIKNWRQSKLNYIKKCQTFKKETTKESNWIYFKCMFVKGLRKG